VTGGTGTLTMPYGPVPLRALGAALELTTNNTPHRFVRLEMPESERLDGNWCNADGACLRLTSAGTFQDGGAVRAAEHSVYPYPESPTGGEGSYELREHTLVLRYARGSELRMGFPGALDKSSSPRELLLGFNGDLLTRR